MDAVDTVVVGVSNEASNQTTITNGTTASNDNSAPASGAAHVFTRDNNTWVQEAYLKASNSVENTIVLASARSVSGIRSWLVLFARMPIKPLIGSGTDANSDDSAGNSGMHMSLFETQEFGPSNLYLKAPNSETDDQFGLAVPSVATRHLSVRTKNHQARPSLQMGLPPAMIIWVSLVVLPMSLCAVTVLGVSKRA